MNQDKIERSKKQKKIAEAKKNVQMMKKITGMLRDPGTAGKDISIDEDRRRRQELRDKRKAERAHEIGLDCLDLIK